MTWPSKDPAARRTRKSRRLLVGVLLVLCLVATLVANAMVVGDVAVAPALTAVLAAILLLRRHHVRAGSTQR